MTQGDRDKILVVDDEEIALRSLERMLRGEGFEVATASNGDAACRLLEKEHFDLVLTDLVMDPIDGLQVLTRAKERDPETQVIIMTGYASVATAIEAMKRQAFHYLQKPLNPDEVLHLVRLALEKRHLRCQVEDLKRRIGTDITGIIGNSSKLLAIKSLIRQVAETDSNVMITGESGTGKELVASAIHHLSRRSARKFLPINCASFTEELLANELFGHEKDAFTGATSTRTGILETADGGTIFFDEVGDMSLAMQAKLLRVVQERELIRVGGNKPVQIDVRIIAATNKNLKMALEYGTFRRDLFYRLNVVPIHMPALAERREDIPLLVDFFLKRLNLRSHKKIVGFSREALDLLIAYDFPGNVRELENIVERAVSLTRTEVIEVDALPEDLCEINALSLRQNGFPVKTLREVEDEYIRKIMARFNNNKSKVARVLGIDRVSLHRKLKRTQIDE